MKKKGKTQEKRVELCLFNFEVFWKYRLIGNSNNSFVLLSDQSVSLASNEFNKHSYAIQLNHLTKVVHRVIKLLFLCLISYSKLGVRT